MSISNEERERQRRLSRLRKVARLMDSQFRIPCTNLSIGLDPLLGLLPGLGDIVGLGVSAWLLLAARRLNLPAEKRLQMALVLLLDAFIGTVPLFGDFFDAWLKANEVCLRMMDIDPAGPDEPIDAEFEKNN